MLLAVAAYALVVLYREACCGIDEVAKAAVETLRSQYWKVPAEVVLGEGAVRVSLPGDWEYRSVWEQTLQAVRQHATTLQSVGEPPGAAQQAT